MQMTGRLSHYIPPNDGCWVGTTIQYTDWEYNLTDYITRLGYNPAAWNVFVELPLPKYDAVTLGQLLASIGKLKAIAMVTVEPVFGLDPAIVTNTSMKQLADIIRKEEDVSGVRTMVRFAHEMNGNWFAWWVVLLRAGGRADAGGVRELIASGQVSCLGDACHTGCGAHACKQCSERMLACIPPAAATHVCLLCPAAGASSLQRTRPPGSASQTYCGAARCTPPHCGHPTRGEASHMVVRGS